jgi:hypothetical protein
MNYKTDDLLELALLGAGLYLIYQMMSNATAGIQSAATSVQAAGNMAQDAIAGAQASAGGLLGTAAGLGVDSLY